MQSSSSGTLEADWTASALLVRMTTYSDLTCMKPLSVVERDRREFNQARCYQVASCTALPIRPESQTSRHRDMTACAS